MFIATLLSDPARPGLSAALLDRRAAAWGASGWHWLSPESAAEMALPKAPADLWAVWEDLQSQGLDLALQPAEGRRKKLLLADMDSTLIDQECIDELAAAAGVGAEVAAITERAMQGALDFDGALLARVALMKGLAESTIAEVLAARITLRPGGAALVATMKAAGAYTALVSGGFTAFAAPVAAQLGFHEARANRLLIEAGHLTGDVARPILGRAAKAEALATLCAARGLSPQEVMAVGDGANDLAMLKAAGAGVAFRAKPIVAAECTLRIQHGDLTALLYLQGYKREDFVV